jgi:hypothetical protein
LLELTTNFASIVMINYCKDFALHLDRIFQFHKILSLIFFLVFEMSIKKKKLTAKVEILKLLLKLPVADNCDVELLFFPIPLAAP